MLQISKLTKRYGRFTALDDLELEIKKGEFFGFVGPNGAGKTTTMRIISGLLRQDEGTVFVDGHDISLEPLRVKEKIGYMPDFFGIYDNLKVLEYMEFYASMYGLEGKKTRKKCIELLNMAGLEDKSSVYVDSLSRGMKQRLCLIRCLVHNPDLLILDEPASGLDPGARIEMRKLLKNINSEGVTIIISSHILSELSETCTNIGIIERGKMVLNGTVERILKALKNSSPILIRVIENREAAVSVMKNNPYVDNMTINEELFSVSFNGSAAEEADLLRMLVENNVQILSYSRRESNLEDLFMRITSREEENKHVKD